MQARQPLPSGNDRLDFDSVGSETIEFSSTQIEDAIALVQALPGEETLCPWQTYLNALALSGLQLWLQERDPALILDWRQGSLNQIPCQIHSQSHPIVSGVRLQGFQVCLLVVGSLPEPYFCLPAPLLDDPALQSHFYILVEVLEEWQRVTIRRFLPADQLQWRRQEAPLLGSAEGTYALPLDWFSADLDQLLLQLHCLQPVAFPWIQPPVLVDAPPGLPDDADLAQPVINTGLWTQDQLDAVAQELNWQLLPAIAPAFRSAVRSPFAELQIILQDLQQQCNLTLPAQARSAYQDAQIADSYIRLYALTWPLLSESGVPEWTLLLILGAQPQTRLPRGIRLQVSDRQQVLVERELEGDPSNAYLYARVAGTWQEVFLVAITLGNGAMLTLPPFAFRIG